MKITGSLLVLSPITFFLIAQFKCVPERRVLFFYCPNLVQIPLIAPGETWEKQGALYPLITAAHVALSFIRHHFKARLEVFPLVQRERWLEKVARIESAAQG